MPARNLSPEARAILATRTVVPLVGVTCAGKNTLMDDLAETYPGFHRVSGFTTRSRRSDEPVDTYRAYLQNDDPTRNSLFSATGPDELVQYEPHPTTGDLYGTMMRDYAGEYNVKDVLAGDAIRTFRTLGFAACNVIAVVIEPEQWQARFHRKDIPSAIERAKRINEGVISLNWALAQKQELLWLENPDGELNHNTARLHQLVTGQDTPRQPEAIQTAKRLLKYFERF